ncbi:MAG: hypothetical protein FD163_132 [Hyphomonadaceae bacterium]|nr:MAG: hypothetical protein FD128_859 [Hyphomonadaceae bacterium]KAF0186857.1 MAG: hypothetical protein FD163_132 [Hyphomonadaceae bacterium]
MVEGARLESVFRFTPNEGSNPSLSAINTKGHFALFVFILAHVGFEPEAEGSTKPIGFGRTATKWRARESGKYLH